MTTQVRLALGILILCLFTPVIARAQNFEPELTPMSVTVTAGDAAGVNFQAAINHDAGFNSSIRVYPNNPPAGITVTPVEQFLDPPYNPVTFNVKASAGTPSGSYPVSMVFSSSQTKSATLLVNVVGNDPRFTISATPSQLEIPQGQTRMMTITATSQNGFQGTVNFTIDGDSANLEITPATFSLNLPPNGSAQQTLTVLARQTAATGMTGFIVYGTSGTLQDSIYVQVNVTAGVPPDYTLNVTPPNPASVPQGGTTRFNISTTPLNGMTEAINFTLTPTAGVTLSETAFQMMPGQMREITATVAPTAAPGPASVAVLARSVSGIEKNATAAFTVTQTTQPDFTTSVSAPNPPTIMAGESTRVTFTATPVGGFNSTINVTVQAPAGVTATPQTFVLSGGNYTREVILQTSGTLSGMQTVTFLASSGTIQRSSTATFNVTPRPAGTAPIIDAVSPELTTPSPSQVVYLVGRNFMPGATITSLTPGVIVESARVFSSNLAEMTVTVRPGVVAGLYRVDLRNPDGASTIDGGRLIIRSRDDLGAPLGVTTAAILEPRQGEIIGSGSEVYPVGHLATTGSGTVIGYWALDGVPFDRFTATVAGGRLVTSVGRCPRSEGGAAQICGQVPIPPLTWGPSHRLELIIEQPRKAVSPAVSVIGSPDSMTTMTVYEPADSAELTSAEPLFRWTLVPGATGYELEFEAPPVENEPRRVVRFRTTETRYRMKRQDLLRLGSGTFRWRVVAVHPGDVRGEATPWLNVRVAPSLVSMKIAEVASTDLTSLTVEQDPSGDPAAPVGKTTNYAVAPNVTITGGKDQDATARAQVSTQGELSAANGRTQFTGDLSYAGEADPSRLIQESRNWVIEAGTPVERAGGSLRFGYVAPDFTDGAEYLTSGLARTGIVARARSRFGTISYYRPVETAIHGVMSGNPEELDIHSFALATPDGRPYSVRFIALQVEEPTNDLWGTPGSRLTTFGVFGRYAVRPWLSVVGEVASGDIEATDGGVEARDGLAMRIGLTGTAGGVSYGLNVRNTGANFVNPANRSLTPGGVSDRLATDLTLAKSFGRASLNLTLTRQSQGRSSESTLPEADQTSAQLGLNTMLGRVSVSLSANTTADEGDGDPLSFLPETKRRNTGFNGYFSETFGRVSLTQGLSVQRMRDDINPMSNQDMTSITLGASGALKPNFNLTMNLSGTRSEGAPEFGTNDNWTLSFQPSIAIPAADLSLQPSVSFSRSENDVMQTESKGESYQAMVQWAPQFLGSMTSAQVSASWNRNGFGGAFPSSSLTRSYQASLTMRLNKQKGTPLFPPRTPLPGEVPPQLPITE